MRRSMYPELNGVPLDQVNNVIRAIGANNPARANEIVAHLNRVNQIQEGNRKVQEHQHRAVQQQVTQWVQQQDAEVESWLAKNEQPHVVQAVKDNLPRVLNHYGVDVQAFKQALTRVPELRDASVQKMLFELGKQYVLKEQMA